MSNLELLKGETPASADLAVVLDGRAADDRAEKVDRAGGDGSGLGDASLAAAELTAGLVEVRPHAGLPLLAEMVVGELLLKRPSAGRPAELHPILKLPTPQHPPKFNPSKSKFSVSFESDSRVTCLVVLDRHCVPRGALAAVYGLSQRKFDSVTLVRAVFVGDDGEFEQRRTYKVGGDGRACRLVSRRRAEFAGCWLRDTEAALWASRPSRDCGGLALGVPHHTATPQQHPAHIMMIVDTHERSVGVFSGNK